LEASSTVVHFYSDLCNCGCNLCPTESIHDCISCNFTWHFIANLDWKRTSQARPLIFFSCSVLCPILMIESNCCRSFFEKHVEGDGVAKVLLGDCDFWGKSSWYSRPTLQKNVKAPIVADLVWVIQKNSSTFNLPLSKMWAVLDASFRNHLSPPSLRHNHHHFHEREALEWFSSLLANIIIVIFIYIGCITGCISVVAQARRRGYRSNQGSILVVGSLQSWRCKWSWGRRTAARRRSPITDVDTGIGESGRIDEISDTKD